MCECERNLEKTEMILTTDTGIHYKIIICKNCKKYYIKRFNWIFEIEYNANGKWFQTGKKIKIA